MTSPTYSWLAVRAMMVVEPFLLTPVCHTDSTVLTQCTLLKDSRMPLTLCEETLMLLTEKREPRGQISHLQHCAATVTPLHL